MLETLRRLVLQVSNAPDLATALGLTVREVRAAMNVDACAIYLVDPADQHLVLMETDGLDRAAIGQVRLAPGEGVIGLVRERKEPVWLDDVSAHPRFRHFPITGEERYRAFLGVPVIHFRKVVGVLVVLQREIRSFDDHHEAFLVTASAQLAGVLAEMTVLSPARFEAPQLARRTVIQGVAGAPGVAIGTAVMPSAHADLDSVPDRTAEDVVMEESAFLDAVDAVQRELRATGERMKGLMPSESLALFDVYALLVGDDSLVSRVTERIREGQWAPAALRESIREFAAEIGSVEDERIRARAEDIRAVGRRLLLQLQVDKRLPREFPARSVLVGNEVGLARIADVPRERLAAVVCLKGSSLSHTAVVARSLGVPAVMGLGEIAAEHLDGRTVVVDGYRGRILLEPSPAVLAEFERLEGEEHALAADLAALRDEPSVTPDGVHLPLYVNVGLLTDIGPSLDVRPDGVGLYRTEFPFMLRETFPAEDEQRDAYREMLEAFAPRPVVMRTLDIGGDKPLPYLDIDEPNSLLGWRGIRVTLHHPEILATQLKAMLRANLGIGNLSILLPMVCTADEVREARAVLDRVLSSLAEEGVEIEPPPLGVMLEVPAAIFQMRELAAQADFFSVGTNDLTQYLLAVDRGNSRVAALFDHLHPVVLRALNQTVTQAREIGVPISVCGELAGEPVGALLLLAMRVDYLSVPATALPRVKCVIRSFSHRRATELLEEALALPDGRVVREHVHRAFEAAGLGGLVRAGR